MALYGTISPDNTLGFRNRIINGDMRIDQRNAGASVNTNSATNPYVVDRWRIVESPGSNGYKGERSTTAPSGFTNSFLTTALTATSFSGTDYHALRQPIEGFNCADLMWGTASASTITLSFWIRSSLTGTFGGAIGNQNGSRSYPFTYTVSSSNTWEYKTITIAGDTTGTWNTNNEGSINVWFSLGAGSDRKGTAGAWNANFNTSATGAVDINATSGATFYITGVQLEAGSVATPFERRPYGTELTLCQRYYELMNIGRIKCVYYAATAFETSNVPYSVTKRASPTMSVTAGTMKWVVPGINIYNSITNSGISFTTTTSSFHITQSRTPDGSAPVAGDSYTNEDGAVTVGASAEL